MEEKIFKKLSCSNCGKKIYGISQLQKPICYKCDMMNRHKRNQKWKAIKSEKKYVKKNIKNIKKQKRTEQRRL